MSAVQTAIQTHGARAVYAAANKAFSGDRSDLVSMGLQVANLADINAIQTEAFKQLSKADRVMDRAMLGGSTNR